MASTATITSKGQITLPGNIRKILGSTTVEFVVVDGRVELKPVRSVAGSLAQYAAEEAPLREIREKVWKEVARGKNR